MKKKQQRWKRAGALTLAVLLGCMAPGTVFGAEIDGLTPEKEARLNDNQIEYDEWFDLLKYKYGPMRSAYKQLEQSLVHQSFRQPDPPAIHCFLAINRWTRQENPLCVRWTAPPTE